MSSAAFRKRTKKPSRSFPIKSAIALLLLVGGAALAMMRDTKPHSDMGMAGHFRLVAHDGEVASDESFLGRPLLVTFGHTTCRSTCPLLMLEVSEALRELGSSSQISAVFVTVDPDHDRPDVLKDFLSAFDPRIVGLSGDAASIAEIMRSYQIFAARIHENDGKYLINHTVDMFLVDRDGRLVKVLSPNTKPSDLARELRAYL